MKTTLARLLPAPLRTQIRHRLRRAGFGPEFTGYVEGITGIDLTGWVVARPRDRGALPVGLFAGDTLLAEQKAQEFRGDVAAAGYGDGGSGFRFALTAEMIEAARGSDGRLSVRLMDGARPVLGEAVLPSSTAGPLDLQDMLMARCRVALAAEIGVLAQALAKAPVDEAAIAALTDPVFERHHLLFTDRNLLPDDRDDIVVPSGQTAYLDYVAYRYRENERFDRRPGGEDNERFLYWYLTTYRAHEPWRVPLAQRDIAFLNESVVMPNLRPSFTRAMWWRLSQQPQLMASLTPDRVEWLIYWWCMAEMPALGFEDCLVPERYAEVMQAIHPVRRLDAFGLSTFTEQFFLGHDRFHFLDMGSADGRRLLVLSLMIIAIGRPDILRYLPPQHLQALLREKDGEPSALERFAAALIPERDDLPRLTVARYKGILRRQGFDLTSRSFLTVTPDGDRFHAAAMPVPAGPPTVDVQMIGPFQKASGLGQAARLSAKIMEHTGYSVSSVDFGMDNPAPEGFSKVGALSEYKRARVNLIQLNAESIPLAFAYQPDVFSGAYNIAYVYWELDSPALCHYLGMEMIDEIWVAAEYGVTIYQPKMDKPVVNVGMCFEDVPDIDRDRARDFVNRRFRLKGNEFVYLVAFDSFSFVQRKNPVAVLEAFRKAFPDREDVRLIVKTQNRNSVSDPPQVRLWRQVDAIMAQDRRIRLMNETLSYDDLLLLKKGSDCYISLHKSEGWGFGMIEAMSLKVPVVVTGYSANMDFCTPETAWLVDYTITPLVPQDYIFVRKGQSWAEPDIDHAAKQLRAVYDNPAERVARAEAALRNVRENFSAEAISRRFKARLDTILGVSSDKKTPKQRKSPRA
jgi:glycosyltransferase involved in cell wall biosynthesis